MRTWDVVVVGGGLAGSAAAARAAGEGASVLVLSGRAPAGRAATDERSGFRLNRGAHALYDRGPGRAVLGRLGVTVTGGPSPLEHAHGRRGDLVDLLPLDPSSAVRTRLLGLRDKAQLVRVLAGLRRWRPEELADRSIAAWIDELGLRPGARDLFEMLVRLAAYAADHDRLSADVAATQIATAGGGVTYVHGGWATLVDGLLRSARGAGAEVRGEAATGVEPVAGGGALVNVGGEQVAAGAVVLAAGSPGANAALLPEPPSAWTAVGPPITAACLDLGLAELPPVPVLLGLDQPLYLIRHAPPAHLAPPGGAVVHALWYRTDGDDPSAATLRQRLEDHARLAGIDPEGAVVARYLHRMTVVSAAATPSGGGLAGRPGTTSSGQPDVLAAGDWVGPVGHLADAALVSGESAGAAAAHRARRARSVTAPGPRPASVQ